MSRSRRLRVAVVARAVMPLHGVGGLERSVRDLVAHLALRGVDVTLITPPAARVQRTSRVDPFSSPHIELRHVPYITFPFANRRGTTILDRSTAYPIYGLRAGRQALALVRAGAVDVVHGFGASVLGYARARARRRGTAPLVFNPQGLEEFGATAAAQPLFKRIGYTPLRIAVRRCARAADAIIATDVSLERTIARHLRPRAGQMHTIPNGIDLAEVTGLAGRAEGALIRRRYGIDAGEFVLVSVGRVEQNKGFDVLADALARFRASATATPAPWRWVVIGVGPYFRALEGRIAELGLADRVLLAGRVNDADLHAWYEAASVFVHPTRYEGSSLVTLEAMAHRRAIIATRAGGLPDKVRSGENGWLVDPDNPVALAAAIDAASRDPQQLESMGETSRLFVERDFSWTMLVDRQIALYERLLAGETRT
jgi:glycosyltransferase involved in cell wall biosynthesis